MPRWFLKKGERIEVVGLSVQGVPEGTFWHFGAWEESGGSLFGFFAMVNRERLIEGGPRHSVSGIASRPFG